MSTNPPEALGILGKLYRMPEGILKETDEAKSAWALGVFCDTTGESDAEVKTVSVEDKGKSYEKLEIHHLSPQMYAILRGSVAIPAAAELDGKAVRFYRVGEGKAILLRAGMWHGGPAGIDIPAKVVVVLKKATSEFDTKKEPVSPAIRFDPEP